MNGDLGVGCLCHGCDLFTFGNAARVCQIGLHYCQRTAAQRASKKTHLPIQRSPAAIGAAARGGCNLIEHLHPFYRHWFFDKERTQRLPTLRSSAWRCAGVGCGYRPTSTFSSPRRGGKKLGKLIHLACHFQPFAGPKVHLERESPTLHQHPRHLCPACGSMRRSSRSGLPGAVGLTGFHCVGQLAGRRSVHADAFVASAAQQTVDGQPRFFADNVPQCHVDAAEVRSW